MTLESFIEKLTHEQYKSMTVEMLVQSKLLYDATREVLKEDGLEFSKSQLRRDSIQETLDNYRVFSLTTD